MKNLFFLASACFILMMFLNSCNKEKGVEVEYIYYEEGEHEMMSKYLNLEEYPLNFDFEFPEYYRATPRSFDRSMATLGRVLFYDTELSDDRTISCASCHKQELAFADDLAFSKGVNGHETARNSLALGSVFNFNEYYNTVSGGFGAVPFFWDNRANSVQEQSKLTFANEQEMNMPMGTVIDRVKEQEYYQPLFNAAYATYAGEIIEPTEDRILDAIGIFIGSLGSANTKFDRALTQYSQQHGSTNNFENASLPLLTDQENEGLRIYTSKCGSCHGNVMGMPAELQANNGLDLVYEDDGIGEGDFKVATLRNIGVTGPYMHDGRFTTLEEVIEHYSSGIQNHSNLSQQLKSGNNAMQMNFSETEKAALLAFLRDACTDDEFLTAKKYSDPFIR